MTAHCYSKWTMDDPIEDCPIQKIAAAVKHHGYDQPGIYGIWTVGDSFIYNIGGLLSRNRGTVLNQELIEQIFNDALKEQEGDPTEKIQSAEHIAISKDVIIRVLKELDLWEKVLPKREIREFKFPDKISIPLVNKPYPPL